MKNRQLLININALTAIGIVIYWLLVFSGLFPVEELVPGYTDWFMSFPIADLWIALCSALAAIFLLKRDEKGVLFGVLAGSSLIFLGLYGFAYGYNTGLLFRVTVDQIIEIGIKLYCLSAGSFLIAQLWTQRHSI